MRQRWPGKAPDTRSVRKVVTKTSGAEIVVDSAIDLGTVGVPFDFYPFKTGSADTSGWHATQMYTGITVYFDVPTLGATGGVDYSVECLSPSLDGARPVVVAAATLATITTEAVTVAEITAAVRVGLKGHDDFAGTDSITVWLQGEMRSR